MPKVFYLITELDIGGAEKNLFRLAVSLKARGWSIEVAALSGSGEVGGWLEAEGIPVHYVGMDFKASPAAFLRLVRLLRTARPDVLHTFLFHANIAGRLARIFSRIPVVISSVRVAERRRPSHLRMDYLTQRLVDAEVCVSEGVCDFTRAVAGIRAQKLFVIPNAVEPPSASRSRGDIRASLRATDSDLIILSVGRLDVQKGYTYLVDAAARLLHSHGNLLFVVAGEGGERTAVEERIASASIGDRFRLLGWHRDVGDLYAAADIFVLPSLWEGMSNALLEACAAGLPAVATDVEGSREIIQDGVNGLLVPPCDVSALATALARTVEDEALRTRIASEGQRAVLRRYSLESFATAHEDLYRRLLSSGAPT